MTLKSLFYVFSSMLLLISSCSINKKAKADNTSNHKGLLIEVNDSTVVINKNTLKMSDSLSAWIKILGPYNRKFSGNGSWDNVYIWDSLGIVVNTYHKDNELYSHRTDLVSQLKVHLQGLDSEVARAGKLEYAQPYNFKSFPDSLDNINFHLELAESAIKFGRITKEEVIQEANEWWADIIEERRPEKYKYPYRSFSGPLYIEEVAVYSDEQLKPLNDRRKANNLDPFSFIDYDSSAYSVGKDSTGETEIMNDAYYYVAHPVNKPKTMEMLRYELKTVYPKISYIRIELNQTKANDRLR